MAQALDRGILNNAATARWLIENVVPEATEAGVVSVLRRWEPTRDWQSEAIGVGVEKETRVSVLSGWTVFDVPRSLASYQRLTKLRQRLHPNESLQVLYGHEILRIVVPMAFTEEARVALGVKRIQREVQSAAKIHFRRHTSEKSFNLPLVTVLRLNAFGSAAIPVLGSYGFGDECGLLVPKEEVERSYRLALALTGDEQC